MKSRSVLPALFLVLTACDGPFEIMGGSTPGNPFDASSFDVGPQSRADLTSVEQACSEYCALQERCDDADTDACVDDCVAAELDSLTAEPPDEDRHCAYQFLDTIDCAATSSCDTFADCDPLLDQYIVCAAG
jgi:hypothetical protein